MKAVIDIDENLYTKLFDMSANTMRDMRAACSTIRNGTPLPKGHRLEQKPKTEPCEDCISRADAIKALKELEQEDIETYGCKIPEGFDADGAIEKLMNLPSVQPKVKQGRWKHKHDDRNDWLECPFCGYGDEGKVRMDQGTAFCPFCGAKLTRWDEGWML